MRGGGLHFGWGFTYTRSNAAAVYTNIHVVDMEDDSTGTSVSIVTGDCCIHL